MGLFSVLAAFYFGFYFIAGAFSSSFGISLSFCFAFHFGFFAIVYFGFSSSGFFFGFFLFVALTFFKPFLDCLSNEFRDEGDRFGCLKIGRASCRERVCQYG